MKFPKPNKLPDVVKLQDISKLPAAMKELKRSQQPKLDKLAQLPWRKTLHQIRMPTRLPLFTRHASPPRPPELSDDTPPRPPTAAQAIWRALTRPLRIINWRIVAAALCGVGVLHIVATLAAPQLAIATAFNRLERILPANQIVVLPEISAGTQPLPFMSPALRYAMCRFDTAHSTIDVSVELSIAGSSLTIYSTEGESIYTAADSEIAQHRVQIIPDDGRFLGLTPEALGRRSTAISSATLHAKHGIVVYAVPTRGIAYQAAAQRQLDAAICQPTQL